jgi:Trypsin-like peptidase domain
MNNSDTKIAILKTLWGRVEDGRWGIRSAKSLALKPQNGFDSDFFKFESEMELFNSGARNIHEIFASFGPTDFLLKQSILLVVAWVENEDVLRCIGTAFVISCTGYVITACHVLLDPTERNYGKVVREGNILKFMGNLHMGVLIPISPAYGVRGYRFFSFEQSWYWGEWKSSPLLHEAEKFSYLTDIAVCKIAEMPNGASHQPLSVSLNSFQIGEKAYVFGYAEMDDLPVEGIENGMPLIKYFKHDLYVSIGEVAAVFPENHLKKDVPTPGPCFDFRAKIPGKMSGGPILGADGAVTRGVVSRSFSGERHAYGAMLGPVMRLSLIENKSLGEHDGKRKRGDCTGAW